MHFRRPGVRERGASDLEGVREHGRPTSRARGWRDAT